MLSQAFIQIFVLNIWLLVFSVIGLMGMGLRFSSKVIAKSRDGKIEVLRVFGRGPEGGTGLSFIVKID